MPRDQYYRPYGHRAKLGFIVPPTNTVNEAEWSRIVAALPAGVSLHAQRMPLHTDTTSAAGKQRLLDDIGAAAGELAKAGVDVIAYACTAGSMVLPMNTLTDAMQQMTGIPAVATAPSLVLAARALAMRRVALATPYHDALNEHEIHFLAACGIEVVNVRGLGIGAGGPHEYVNIARTPKEKVFTHCQSADVPAADGMIVSCTDFATIEVLPRLERVLGKPVVSSNLATLWQALRVAGLTDRVDGFGALLAHH